MKTDHRHRTIVATFLAIGWVVQAAAAGTMPGKVYVFDGSNATDAERVMIASVMGIVNKTSPEIYVGQDLWTRETLAQFPQTVFETRRTAAWFLDRYRAHFAGYVLCDADTRNEGTSVAGILSAVLVDTSLEQYAVNAGLGRLLDVRGKDSAWVYANYGSQLNKRYLFTQFPNYPHHLRDLAIYHNGFMCHEPPAIETYYANQEDGSQVFGWAPSEYNFFSRATRHKLFGVPADWLQGASATCQWPVPIPRQPAHVSFDTPTEPGRHYVAFVMSDGDNVQFLTNAFFNDPWFGSPHRGEFTMNWDVNPLIADISSVALRYYYTAASNGAARDFFVNAGGPGLIYPSQSPDLSHFIAANSKAMSATDMNVISVLDESWDIESIEAILSDPQVLGMMVKTGNAYKGKNGAIHWFNGKPAVSVKYTLWEGFDTAEGLVTTLNAAPRDPLNNQASYTIVNVHPWSPTPMDKVAYIASHVDPAVKLVSLEELILHLRRNFGTMPGHGLYARYYDDANLADLAITRVDRNVNVNWGENAPHSVVGANTFSVRWTGQVQVDTSEPYTFYTLSDDGVRLWIDDVQLIDDWTDHGLEENQGTIRLTPGPHAIRMEFYDNQGSAMVTLSWSSPSLPKQLIPPERLRPCLPTGALPAGWLSEDVGAASIAGCAGQVDGHTQISASGVGMSGRTDVFHFLHREWSRDGKLVARVVRIDSDRPDGRAGLMLRQSLDWNAPHVALTVDRDGDAVLVSRSAAGEPAVETPAGRWAFPCLLKFQRTRDTIAAFISQDGQGWTAAGTIQVPGAAYPHAGVVVSSYDPTALTTARVADLEIENDVPGDFDADRDVDQEDFGHFQACLSESFSQSVAGWCEDADFNGDTRVDAFDFLMFTACLSGPDQPSDSDCLLN